MGVSELLAAFLSAALTLVTVVFTPIGEALAKRIVSRDLHFSADHYSLTDNLALTIRPASRAARRRKPLGIAVDGQFFPSIASPKGSGSDLSWTVDLYYAGIRDPIFTAGNLEIQFYFDPGHLSAPLRFTISPQAAYISALSESKLEWKGGVPTVRASDTNTFMRAVAEKGSVEIAGGELVLALPPTSELEKAAITEVFDGRELTFTGLTKLNLTSRERTALLAEPRYAWVLNFRESSGIRLAGIKLGHTQSGYCQGGVLRLQECNLVEVADCDLFGSGTVGFEIDRCNEVYFSRTTIHDCTYSIGAIKNSQYVTFDRCTFKNNREFLGIVMQGRLTGIRFVDCVFLDNAAKRTFLGVYEGQGLLPKSIVFERCRFENNRYPALSDDEAISLEGCRIRDSQVPKEEYVPAPFMPTIEGGCN